MSKMAGLGAGACSSSSKNGKLETDDNGNEIDDYLDESIDSDNCEARMEETTIQIVPDDVAPVFILQPKEIIKNIDLMKTVAILMENKLQSWATVRRLDDEKLKDLCSDIERFPEAFQKFISIIHQIQYLNVTSDWNFANNGDSIPISSRSTRGSVISRLLGSFSDKAPIHPAVAEQDARKQVMLHLLTTLHQVFIRYLKIQNTLEDKVKKCSDLLLTGDHSGKLKCSNASDSDDDDPNLPLLVPSKRRSRSSTSSRRIWLDKIESLRSILRRTKRTAAEVQDSLEVLRDLIQWDYKQMVSNVQAPTQGSSQGHPASYFDGNINDSTYVDVARLRCSEQHAQMDPDFLPVSNGYNRRRRWSIFAVLAGILVILVTIAGLSFLKFRY